MKPEEYWAKRMEALNEAMLAKGEEYIRKQNEEYEKALARIRKQTEAWYARLAKNNDISLAEARKLLDRNELKEFHWTVEEYIQRGRENAVDQRWMKELENASAKVHITRLQELEMHLRNEIEQLAAKRLKGTTDTLGGIYKDSYYRSIYELQKGTGVGSSFAMLDDRQIDKVLTKPWAPDGSNFSARIWKDRDKLVNELQTILTQDLIRGEPAEKVIADFAERMNVSKHAAARLIRTEAAFFSGQSRLDAYREMGVEEYKIVATLDLRTSEICQEMDGRVFRLSEAKAGVNYPPLHVYCRSTTIPYFEDAAPGERAARSDSGDTYYVPGNITYKEWAEKHAPEAAKPPKPVEPDPVTAPNITTVTPSLQSPRPTPPKKVRSDTEREKDRTFSTQDEVDAWVDAVAPRWLAELTIEETQAIRKYTGDYYETVNRALRDFNPTDEIIEFTERVAGALSKFSLTESIVVWRGLEANIFGTDDPKKLIGSEYDDPGFFSTSLLRETAFKGPVLMIVHLPAGSAGAPIAYMSQIPGENEFLLPPGAHYVILDAWKEKDVLIVVVEVVDE